MSTDSKRDRAVIAAADLFMRYGFARTTMGDIAKAADMSRPALYLLFPGKEEVFEAAVLYLNDGRSDEFRAAIEALDNLRDRLFIICERWLVNVYELRTTVPDAGDMDDLAFPVVRKVYADLQALLAEVIVRSGVFERAGAGGIRATPLQIARNLVFGIRGLGAPATNIDDMREMTLLQIDLLCAALERSPASA
jgi:AcrR family transcriptional regulator